MRRVTVAVDPPYDVVVDGGALARVADVVGDRRCVALVAQPEVVFVRVERRVERAQVAQEVAHG